MAASLAEVAMESQQDDHPIDVTPAGGWGPGSNSGKSNEPAADLR
jgi:hypothetical protein